MITIGSDVHYRNSVFHANGPDGKVLVRGRAGNSLLELAELLAPVERHARDTGHPVRAVLESTMNSRAIRNLLLEYARRAGFDLAVDVVHARKIRVIAESVTKCDRLDAQILCQLAGCNLTLPVCYMPDDEEFALREHLRARSDLVCMRTMLKNRVHAVLHRRGILTPIGDLFTRSGRTFLEQVQLDDAGRTLLTRFLALMDQFDDVLAQSVASLREIARRERWMKPAALLQTMPGIGLITSLTLLAELGSWKRFRSRAAVAHYAGLTPRIRASNQTSWSGGITGRGPGHLRAMMIEAAWVAITQAPVYRALFERIQNKKGRKTAIVAVAREMLEDAFTMLRKNEPFRHVADAARDRAPSATPRRDVTADPTGRPSVASSVAG